MSRSQWLLIAVAAMLAVLALVWAQAHAAAAAAERQAAVTGLQQTAAAIAELHQLSSVRDAVPSARRPDEDLVGSVHRALRRAGVGEDRFVGLQHRDDRQIPDSQVQVQRVQLRLRALQVHELGSFFQAWRGEPNPWRLSELQLTHDRRSEDDRYDVTVLLAAPYLALQ
ncbi:MAG: hypothetical protein PF961_13450 [Planctomycetota bacterium]|jgi:hypothetical protein|nr:hypothetical protein [Planctomycetota bacterium]